MSTPTNICLSSSCLVEQVSGGIGATLRPPATVSRLLIVFVDRSGCWWLAPLRRGFRHCFAVVECGAGWIVVDPLKSHTFLDYLQIPKDFDLGRFYADRGHTVVAGSNHCTLTGGGAGLRPLTCVEVVKRLAGIAAPLAFTPRQLYRHVLTRYSDRFKVIGAAATQSLDIA